ncbi:MAG: hypothetical protein P8Y71_26035 [Pseudolabrys sp.]
MFLSVERRQSRLGRFHLGFDIAQLGGGIDQRLAELAAVGADLLDLALEGGFVVGRFALLFLGRLELLVVLFERLELFGLVVLRRLLRLGERRLQPNQCQRQGKAQPGKERGARIKA